MTDRGEVERSLDKKQLAPGHIVGPVLSDNSSSHFLTIRVPGTNRLLLIVSFVKTRSLAVAAPTNVAICFLTAVSIAGSSARSAATGVVQGC